MVDFSPGIAVVIIKVVNLFISFWHFFFCQPFEII
ncbi:Uncharacterised protein [Mycobacteroides abscessus subsp. abscessus]|nr:Uncharacterised protein [Mycobacteroides abscessus subsp. abscessus]